MNQWLLSSSHFLSFSAEGPIAVSLGLQYYPMIGVWGTITHYPVSLIHTKKITLEENTEETSSIPEYDLDTETLDPQHEPDSIMGQSLEVLGEGAEYISAYKRKVNS